MDAVLQMRKRRIKFDLSRLKWREAMEHTAQPWPMWFPDDEDLRRANIKQFCRRVGLDSLAALYEWSINQPGDFWAVVVDQLGIKFQTPPNRTLNLDDGVASPRWLEGSGWNIVESCFQRDDGEVAVICGDHSGALTTVSVADLRRDMLRVAKPPRLRICPRRRHCDHDAHELRIDHDLSGHPGGWLRGRFHRR